MKAQVVCTNILLLLILISTRFPVVGNFHFEDGGQVSISLAIGSATIFVGCMAWAICQVVSSLKGE